MCLARARAGACAGRLVFVEPESRSIGREGRTYTGAADDVPGAGAGADFGDVATFCGATAGSLTGASIAGDSFVEPKARSVRREPRATAAAADDIPRAGACVADEVAAL